MRTMIYLNGGSLRFGVTVDDPIDEVRKLVDEHLVTRLLIRIEDDFNVTHFINPAQIVEVKEIGI